SLYKNIFTKTFKDGDVTKENFETIKEFLKNTNVDDVVLVFIAGHGVLDDKFDYYYCTADIDFDNPSARGLSYENIESVFNGIKAVRKLLFMDTCHSGELDKDEVEKTKTVEKGDVAFRAVGDGVRKKEGFGMENSVQLMENLFSNIKKGTGTTVISSAGGAEYAMESDIWKNGLFTFCLLKGLSEKSADNNGDKEISISEIQKYVKEQVSELSKGKQVPTARTENLTLDYRVW
ncbi:MAG: caspase family protein, partial [Bacteroidia bacterium]|nr:caspase family protein [Bacteroidia bacterium]